MTPRARCGMAAIVLLVVLCSIATAHAQQGTPGGKIIGMYVHQHWPYNHPYAARTWTIKDWRGYADGMKKLGYNTFLIWPMLETMPNPLTPSDRSNIEKIRKVIDMLHSEFGMKAHVIICPNVVAVDSEATKATFEKRHFFYTDARVNPGDPAAMARMMAWREKLLRPLAKADGFVIIDSDPGGYPGSTNQEFVNLLGDHRKLLDRLRPGIELYYWMHAGWPAYCRFYQTGNLEWGKPEEFEDALSRLNALNPEPWGLANGLRYAKALGLDSRVVSYNYGAIEGEPSFPLTNFGGDGAYNSGRDAAPRGVIGNAQTHCVQLPNTFAFVRGALGLPITDADYVQFANDLIPGQGRMVVDGWQALAGDDSTRVRAMAARLGTLADTNPATGRLRGLLFGSAHRFLMDLVMQLKMKAAYKDFVSDSANSRDIRQSFRDFVKASEVWQHQHGYECAWGWPGLAEALRTLGSPAIDAAMDPKIEGDTPFDRVHDSLRVMETSTSRLIAAMRKALPEVEARAPVVVRPSVGSESEVLTLRRGNWAGDRFTRGGLDDGMDGDNGALVASAASAESFGPTATMRVDLSNDYSSLPQVRLTIGYRRNELQTKEGTVLWDGRPICTCRPKGSVEQLVTTSVTVSTSGFSFSAGKHRLEIRAGGVASGSPGYFEVDAVGIAREAGQIAEPDGGKP